MMDKEICLDWLCDWYQSNCDGDWEHEFGVKIETIDNPGWSVTIDIENTRMSNLYIPWKFVRINSKEWYGYKIENSRFEASGDPSKLMLILGLFKSIIQTHG